MYNINKQEKFAIVKKHYTFPKYAHPKATSNVRKSSASLGRGVVRDPRTSFKLFTQVLDVGEKTEFSQNSIEGCILKPYTGSSSVPVMNLGT